MDRIYWLCQLAGWGSYALLNMMAAVLGGQISPARAVVEMTALSGIGLVITHSLHLFIRAYGWRRLPLSARIPRLLAASVILSLPAAGIEIAFGLSAWKVAEAAVDPPLMRVFLTFWLHAANWMLLVFVWSWVYFAGASIRDRQLADLRESELARALQFSELRLLKSQINPHFLFNALNAVRALIADDPAGAQNAVTQLARILRYSLGSGQEEMVALDQELAVVEDYLALESLRLGDRLRIEREIDPAARNMRIPVMLLQTLVENAIKHGIAELPAGGAMRISAGPDKSALMLTVINPRPLVPPHAAHEGVGLHNARERLRLLFGQEAGLQLDLSHPDLARALIRVPPIAMKAMLIDDEPLARRELRRLLSVHPWLEVVAEAGTIEDAAEKIAVLAPDLLFLDIQMPGGSGFDLLERIERLPQVIFATAYDRHAVRAFEVNALDYLLKPIEPERLAAALARARAAYAPSGEILERLFVRDGPRCWLVPLNEVRLLAAEDNYVRLYWGALKPLLGRALSGIEPHLDPERFFRANRAQIVNLNFIARMEPQANGRLHLALRDGPDVEISRRQARLFRARARV